MISKIFTGHSFAGAVRYVCENKQRAEVLLANGVQSHDWRKMVEDFQWQQRLQPNKKAACFHAILSFSPDDKIDRKMMSNITQHWLAEMGLADTQFAIVKHNDKAHPHVHLIANLVDNKGKSIHNGFLGLKGKRISQRLTKEYGLIPADKKDLSKTHQEALSEVEAARYQIYQAIQSALPFCNTLEDLAFRLKKKDIDTILKYKGGSSIERQGISFQLGKHVFKGSKVDRSFSINRLEKKLLFHQEMRMAKRDVLTAYQPSTNPAGFTTSPFQTTIRNQSDGIGKGVTEAIIKDCKEVISNLLQPEQGYDPLAGEITRANRKKKKKGRGLN